MLYIAARCALRPIVLFKTASFCCRAFYCGLFFSARRIVFRRERGCALCILLYVRCRLFCLLTDIYISLGMHCFCRPCLFLCRRAVCFYRRISACCLVYCGIIGNFIIFFVFVSLFFAFVCLLHSRIDLCEFFIVFCYRCARNARFRAFQRLFVKICVIDRRFCRCLLCDVYLSILISELF